MSKVTKSLNSEELRKVQEIERKQYVEAWNEFVEEFILKFGKIPMPGIFRTFSSTVQFEMGTIEFFEASPEQKNDAKKQAKKKISLTV